MLTTYHARSRRGAVMLWFVLIQLPVLFLALAMTVDFTRVYLAHRQVANAAQAAAQAGAQQIAAGSGANVLNPIAATAAAKATFAQAEASNAIPVASTNPPPIVTVTVNSADTTITVTVTYQPANLMFAKLFPSPTNTVTATAFVCVPGQSANATQGYCATPSA